ncbi:MAG TPA: dTMP kinase [Cyanobacteria bacterium UBA8156]|jgi:dTMP kinase|nr:dTMP kinase [Cyanobacteria bacterium UBA8156]
MIPRFITLEGTEGTGKTTQLHRLAEVLRARGHRVTTTREPGGSTLGPDIRRWLLHSQDLEAATELFLLLADRRQHVAEVIAPALAAGHIVLCDRFTDSTIAYQHHGRGLPLAVIRDANALATAGLQPDRTLLLLGDVARCLSRAQQAKGGGDRLDREGLAFHHRVAQGFRDLARQFPDRIHTIDANGDLDTVTQHIHHALAIV